MSNGTETASCRGIRNPSFCVTPVCKVASSWCGRRVGRSLRMEVKPLVENGPLFRTQCKFRAGSKGRIWHAQVAVQKKLFLNETTVGL